MKIITLLPTVDLQKTKECRYTGDLTEKGGEGGLVTSLSTEPNTYYLSNFKGKGEHYLNDESPPPSPHP